MQKGLAKKIKLFVTIAIILAIVWFLIVSPMITFRNNENKLLEAAKRYFKKQVTTPLKLNLFLTKKN